MTKPLRLIATFLFAVFLAVSAYAADIAGSWKLTVNTQAGVGTPTLVLVQDGEDLSGTYTGRFGTSPITGTFKDGAITFTFEVSGPMGSGTATYTGTVEGDAMSGSLQIGAMAGGTFTGKKQP